MPPRTTFLIPHLFLFPHGHCLGAIAIGWAIPMASHNFFANPCMAHPILPMAMPDNVNGIRGIIIEREGTTTPKNQYSISNPCHAHFG